MLLSSQGFTQFFDEGARANHWSENQEIVSCTTLPNGNVVLMANGTGEQISVYSTTGGLYSSTEDDQAIVCYSNDLSEVVWSLSISNNPSFEVGEIISDEYGNTYAFLEGFLTTDLSLGSATFPHTSEVCAAVVKIDQDGNPLWCRWLEAKQFYRSSVMHLQNDELHLLVSFEFDFENPLTLDTIYAVGSLDYYVMRLSLDNVVTGLFHIHGSSIPDIQSFAVAPNGNYVFHGEFTGPLSVDGVPVITDSGMNRLLFELSPDGSTLLGSCKMIATSARMLYDSQNRVHVALRISGGAIAQLSDTVVNTISASIFFARMDENLEIDWGHSFAASYGDPSSNQVVIGALVQDCNGDLYITGRTMNDTQFGDFTFVELPGGANNWGDLFVVKTDSLGEPQWLLYGGADTFRDEGMDLAIDNEGNVFVAGYFMSDASFGSLSWTTGGGMHEDGVLLKIADGADFSDSYTITGLVEKGESPYGDEQLWFYDQNEDLISTVLTDSEGYYEFTSPTPAVYIKGDESIPGLLSLFHDSTLTIEASNPLYIPPCNDTLHYDFGFLVDDVGILERKNVSINVHPNPTKGRVRIASSELVGRIHIIDVTGRVVKKFNYIDTFEFELDLSDIPRGCYLLKIHFDHNSIYRRILKN